MFSYEHKVKTASVQACETGCERHHQPSLLCAGNAGLQGVAPWREQGALSTAYPLELLFSPVQTSDHNSNPSTLTMWLWELLESILVPQCWLQRNEIRTSCRRVHCTVRIHNSNRGVNTQSSWSQVVEWASKGVQNNFKSPSPMKCYETRAAKDYFSEGLSCCDYCMDFNTIQPSKAATEAVSRGCSAHARLLPSTKQGYFLSSSHLCLKWSYFENAYKTRRLESISCITKKINSSLKDLLQGAVKQYFAYEF